MPPAATMDIIQNSQQQPLFFRVPREIRDNIYAHLFEGSNRKRLRIFNPIEQPRLTSWNVYSGIRKSVSLLRVCRTIQSEAAASLYGNNIFVFDDKVVAKSTNWAKSRSFPREFCGVTFMYTFLRLIGAQNRKSIRFLEIRLNNNDYFYYNYELLARTYNGGQYLGEAFDILAQGHALQELKIRLNSWTEDDQRPIVQFLRPLRKSRLLRKLMKLSGGITLTICPEDEDDDDEEITLPQQLQPLYQKLITRLATPRETTSTTPTIPSPTTPTTPSPTTPTTPSPTTPTTPTPNPPANTKPQTVIEQVRTAAERYTELQNHAEDAEIAITQWETLIQRKKESIRGFQAEMKEIDDDFAELKEIVENFPSEKSSRKRTAEQAAL